MAKTDQTPTPPIAKPDPLPRPNHDLPRPGDRPDRPDRPERPDPVPTPHGN